MQELHKSVLLDETINELYIKKNGIYVDMTLGYGGHSSEILKQLNNTGHLYCFDQDINAIEKSNTFLNKVADNFTIIKSNFVNVQEELAKYDISKADGFIFDLGVSSPQLDEDDRGFSYHKDARLDMRMDQNNNKDAYKVVNEYSLEELIKIFYEYGEEKHAVSIAKNIIKARSVKPITTTTELVNIISSCIPMKEKIKKHPAKKVFQAIRIEVNDELNIFSKALRKAIDMLNINGRICVITFHSLEDRICKNIFQEKTKVPDLIKGLPNIDISLLPDYKLVNNKVIIPSDSELEENNRSRSAKLRVIERIK